MARKDRQGLPGQGPALHDVRQGKPQWSIEQKPRQAMHLSPVDVGQRIRVTGGMQRGHQAHQLPVRVVSSLPGQWEPGRVTQVRPEHDAKQTRMLQRIAHIGLT